MYGISDAQLRVSIAGVCARTVPNLIYVESTGPIAQHFLSTPK